MQAPTTQSTSPVLILEGADGVGKSTLARNLQQSLQALLLKTPPTELEHLRHHFDAADPQLRRAFYLLGNYVCAASLRQLEPTQPVLVDRFWPSSAAYALTYDFQCEHPEISRMPTDLADLLPFGRPVIFLVMTLPEEAPRSS